MLFSSINTLVWINRIVKTKVWKSVKMKSSPESIPTLKQLIECANITQRELSKRTGIAEVTINSWVAKKKNPRLDNALVLCRELGISLKTLAHSLGLDTTGIPDDSPN